MRLILPILAALTLTGCGSLKGITPEQATGLVNAFAGAGCKGNVHISFGGATGQLGGGFHAENSLDGACDPASVHPLSPAGVAAALSEAGPTHN